MAFASRFVSLSCFVSIFLTNRLDFTKSIISLALMASESIAHEASIDSEPIRARGIIVKYYRFIWLNGSITLIRAETERYDIVRFSKVTTKSLASGTGS